MRLDLSSNNIKKIEGLDNLRKLEILLLAKNRISVIENMDTLEELTIFNIGHNCIEQQDNVTFSSTICHFIQENCIFISEQFFLGFLVCFLY